MKYYETDEDPDTLAILYRGDVRVRFITADDAALGTKDYRVLLWDSSNIVIGISATYSRDIIDEFVVSKITEDMIDNFDEELKREMVRDIAIKHLADTLEGILENLVRDRSANYIEETSFEEGIKDILGDY